MNTHSFPRDVDPDETREWVDSLEDLLTRWGPERVRFLLSELEERARARGVQLPFHVFAPARNTIAVEDEPEYPGDEELEEQIERLIRWNAMAMVVRANQDDKGLGGHIATYASMATLYEVGFNHFFKADTETERGDHVFFQGHASPGVYARALLEGRLSARDLNHFRQELAEGGGLASYPHPWLMPEFWQFPTVSLGLGAINAIYQARFNRYLRDRGILDTDGSHVWAFIGDGEVDEVETRGAIDIATREHLDNLTFVINCNLQRLDGPVRGNSSIISELEGTFRGGGWNVIKVLWSGGWDELFAADEGGHLLKRLGALVDGELQKFSAEHPDYMRKHLFEDDPLLAPLVAGWSDEQFHTLAWGGHDRRKVYAAYNAARTHTGAPTVILAKTVKGWGMGSAGKARNRTHGVKKLKNDALIDFRDFFSVDLDDDAAREPAYLIPPEDGPERSYVRARREALGGFLPARQETAPPLDPPAADLFDEFKAGSERAASTTMAYVRLLGKLMRDPAIGRMIVPIVPDEARTFGMESFFREFGIYSPIGQVYDPVDSNTFLYYREAKDGQFLEEGITEAGCMASFIAAGTAYATHGVNTIPFFTYYSMFGFQRVGDLIWAAADMRCRGFLMGATAGRTTLNGEGLQHQDGHSHLIAAAFPNVRAYDPAYAYETAILIEDGLRRMTREQEPLMYYITLHNENYVMPALPDEASVAEGIVSGLYRLRQGAEGEERAQLFGSGSILPQVLRAADILAADYGVACDVWSATSYKQLRTDALAAEHWNRLHPLETPRSCYLWDTLDGARGPFVAASDNVALVASQIEPWIPGRFWALGTDGFGRSDTRARLRRHFEVDAESVVVATLHALASEGRCEASVVDGAIKTLGIDPNKQYSLFA